MLKNGPTNSSVPRNSARDIKTSRRLRQSHDISKPPETGWIFNRPKAALLFVEQDTEKFGLPSYRANSTPKQLGTARGACPSFR
jgi:hypothetical protein